MQEERDKGKGGKVRYKYKNLERNKGKSGKARSNEKKMKKETKERM